MKTRIRFAENLSGGGAAKGANFEPPPIGSSADCWLMCGSRRRSVRAGTNRIRSPRDERAEVVGRASLPMEGRRPLVRSWPLETGQKRHAGLRADQAGDRGQAPVVSFAFRLARSGQAGAARGRVRCGNDRRRLRRLFPPTSPTSPRVASWRGLEPRSRRRPRRAARFAVRFRLAEKATIRRVDACHLSPAEAQCVVPSTCRRRETSVTPGADAHGQLVP
jgi:hypothetical protein